MQLSQRARSNGIIGTFFILLQQSLVAADLQLVCEPLGEVNDRMTIVELHSVQVFESLLLLKICRRTFNRKSKSRISCIDRDQVRFVIRGPFPRCSNIITDTNVKRFTRPLRRRRLNLPQSPWHRQRVNRRGQRQEPLKRRQRN